MRMACRQSTATYTTQFPANDKPYIVAPYNHLVYIYFTFSCTVAHYIYTPYTQASRYVALCDKIGIKLLPGYIV